MLKPFPIISVVLLLSSAPQQIHTMFPVRLVACLAAVSLMLSLLSSGASASASASSATTTAMEEKLAKLHGRWTESAGEAGGVLRLTSDEATYFYSAPHNDSLVLVATALDSKVACAPCRWVAYAYTQTQWERGGWWRRGDACMHTCMLSY